MGTNDQAFLGEVRSELMRMPEQQRGALELRFARHNSFEVMANELSVSEADAADITYGALRALKERVFPDK